MAIKRGSLVRAVREQLQGSLEAQASDALIPNYVFETAGEVVDMKDDYLQIKFGVVPTPTIWLRADQVEEIGG
ncbi:NAD(P)H-quinone oxidoreductase subunit O [Synechococcus sp. Nb3U1]|uniref:NAD(P)H-quinone oxidoreductase subunit O n=1 Tax=Synechococcus sp. Nb3U1 TaxID=1914529 RepID=UPI001F2D1918|nr:NAD(P)H-quinone oxidoreductase subunit O [Synechococcus sp. Nb3U1]MCF2970160.1 NAD(P)H-quinone oxidoreductase subunit O [Synechococcus sp. Nb3U1]